MTSQELYLNYEYLKKKIIEMLDCQQAYFKSNKDFQLLKKAKALETEIRILCTQTKTQQQSIFNDEFLGK
jgi:hypothetical protein